MKNKIILGIISLAFVLTPVVANAQSAGGSPSFFRQLGSAISTVVSSLRVGFGTTTPYAKFAVTGTSGQLNPLFQIASSTNTPTFTLDKDGVLTLGTTTAGALNITSAGLVYAASASAGTVTSVGLADSNSTLTIGNTPITTSGNITATLNLAHENTWTALQSFSTGITTNISSYLNLTSSGVTHPITTILPTNQYAKLMDRGSTAGGLAIIGVSDIASTNGVNIQAYIGTTSASVPAMYFYGAKSNGTTGATTLADTEVVLRISNYTNDLVELLGSGKMGLGSTTPMEKLTVIGGIVSAETAVATSTSITINMTDSNQQLIQIGTSATTITLGTLTAGQAKRIVVCNPASTASTLAWATSPANKLLWTGGTVPTHTTTANKCDIYTFTVTQATSTVATSPNVFGGYVQNF